MRTRLLLAVVFGTAMVGLFSLGVAADPPPGFSPAPTLGKAAVSSQRIVLTVPITYTCAFGLDADFAQGGNASLSVTVSQYSKQSAISGSGEAMFPAGGFGGGQALNCTGSPQQVNITLTATNSSGQPALWSQGKAIVSMSWNLSDTFDCNAGECTGGGSTQAIKIGRSR